MKRTALFVAVVLTSALTTSARAVDWPAHRGDNARSAASDQELALPLHLAWSRQETHLPAPSYRETHVQDGQVANITHDFANCAVTAEGKVFFGSSSEDCVRALDLETGKLLWTGQVGSGGQTVG